MTDIGLFAPYDTFVIVMIGMAPGLLIGMLTGALCWRSRRIVGSIFGLVIGGLVFVAGWLVYFIWFK